jgi:hypothetical protein
MPAREYAMIVKESSYGTPVADPTLGTDSFYLRLSDGNSFSMQAAPVIGDIMYGGGVATPACSYSDQTNCTGNLQGVCYAGAYSKLLADWALTQINTGRTAPWTTTDAAQVMPVTDLASVSIYHAIQRSDSTYDLRRYSGIKVASGSFDVSSQGDRLLKFNFALQGIRDDTNAAGTVAYPDATEFPAPDETDYPCGPYLFSHTAGKLKIASVRTQYDSLSLKFTNAMAPKFFESKYIQLNKFCGRSTTLDVNLYMKVSPNDLASLQALTALDTELTFDNGTNTLKFDLNTKNVFKSLPRDLPLNGTYSWNATVQNYFDPTTASDIVVSAT